MSTYAKLFGSIVHSTVWSEPLATRVVWVTMLALADRDGIVEAAVPGLVRAANVSREECEAALTSFLAPDLDSRTPDNEGRRIAKVDGGWQILNYEKYRDLNSKEERASKTAARQRRWRDRNVSSRTVTPRNARSHDVTKVTHSGSGSGSGSPQLNSDKKADIAPAAPTPFTICRDVFVARWEAGYGEKYPFAPKDGVQLGALLKQNPQVVEGWRATVDRYLEDIWWGQNGRHGLAALCTNIVKFSGPAPKNATKADRAIQGGLAWLDGKESAG